MFEQLPYTRCLRILSVGQSWRQNVGMGSQVVLATWEAEAGFLKPRSPG